jgi:catechol 2,3-dioxygenase-like lactoylglutathione lyase family enzyme
MARVIVGNHSSAIVPRKDRDTIRKFYCDVLGARIMKAEDDRDFLRLGDDFYIAFLYGDLPQSVWLEIKSDNVEETSRKILEFGLVQKLEVRDPHLYFQAPGGQCWRVVGIDEDLSKYEGGGDGPEAKKVKRHRERS